MVQGPLVDVARKGLLAALQTRVHQPTGVMGFGAFFGMYLRRYAGGTGYHFCHSSLIVAGQPSGLIPILCSCSKPTLGHVARRCAGSPRAGVARTLRDVARSHLAQVLRGVVARTLRGRCADVARVARTLRGRCADVARTLRGRCARTLRGRCADVARVARVGFSIVGFKHGYCVYIYIYI